MPTQKEKDALILKEIFKLDPEYQGLTSTEQGYVNRFLERSVDPRKSVFNAANQGRADLSKTDAIVFDKIVPKLNELAGTDSPVQLLPNAREQVGDRNLELEGIRRSTDVRSSSSDKSDAKLDRVIKGGAIGRESDPRKKARLQNAKREAEAQGVPLTERFMLQLEGKAPEVAEVAQPVETPGVIGDRVLEQIHPLLAVDASSVDPSQTQEFDRLRELAPEQGQVAPVGFNALGQPPVEAPLQPLEDAAQDLPPELSEGVINSLMDGAVEAPGSFENPIASTVDPVDIESNVAPVPITSDTELDGNFRNLGGGGGGLGGFLGSFLGGF